MTWSVSLSLIDRHNKWSPETKFAYLLRTSSFITNCVLVWIGEEMIDCCFCFLHSPWWHIGSSYLKMLTTCIYTSLHLISNKLAHRLRSWNNIWWDSNSDNNILLIFILSLIVTDMTLRMEPTYAVNKTFDLWVEIFRDKNFPKLL